MIVTDRVAIFLLGVGDLLPPGTSHYHSAGQQEKNGGGGGGVGGELSAS